MTAMENGYNIDSIYLDFQKAFDQSDFGVIMSRCLEIGITGDIGAWIYNYLIQREQYVIVNNEISRVAHVRSGVPQGSVLGPLLFLILIDSIGLLDLDAYSLPSLMTARLFVLYQRTMMLLIGRNI